jgi:hypothetical protein
MSALGHGTLMSEIPLVIAVVIAIIGSLGGFAAILKVNSDNSNTVADGATKVVVMMERRLEEAEERLQALEEYHEHFDNWVDRLVDILDRTIKAMPDAIRDQFATEAATHRLDRPPKRKLRES